MTREEAAKILDPETTLDTYAKISYSGCFEGENVWQDAVNEACRMGAEALRTLDAQEKPKTPCDLCLYNPPSSGDGKPCTMCPASSLPEPPKEDKHD